MVTLDNLLEKIEQTRSRMLTLSRRLPLTSDAVVTASVQLDDLLNEYEKQRKDI
ncbi:aspartyl-phosphate phosphatase Spo0E family protein [Terribacillus sp. 179-K 1B1 HS]|uniref:Spo0E family sporulation regulatory protein-aspartic acid phosphatase n=1 Tax=Terribacillus sp. 179-K 1B1 HS TaxID=3142388 RepID=UPI0039A18F9A